MATAMTRAIEWWATSVLKDKLLMGASGKKKLMTMDINKWLDTNIPKMVAAIPKITYKNFPRQKKGMNLADRIKHKLTDITGTANTRCKAWGEYFKDNYQERWKMLTEAMFRLRLLVDAGNEDARSALDLVLQAQGSDSEDSSDSST